MKKSRQNNKGIRCVLSLAALTILISCVNRKEVQKTKNDTNEIFIYTSDSKGGKRDSFVWPDAKKEEWPVEKSDMFKNIEFTEHFANYTKADTWYPSWASDGNLYSGWTDGTIGKMDFLWSGAGEKAATGQAKISGDNPLNLTIENLGTHMSSAQPYRGRYPCGSLVYNGVWYYGTYALHQANEEIKKNYGWYVLGPFVGFRWSVDYGKSWTETPHTPANPLFEDPTFEEYDHTDGKKGPFVKLGAPQFVDFGKNMEHSPDGKAYLVGHGSSSPDDQPRIANNSWNSGDQIYMARVVPSVENMNDASKYEFYGGRDDSGNPIWTREYGESKPIFEWNNTCGIVTMTYNAPLKKYLMSITHGNKGNTSRRSYDTYILESDDITGPWKMISYMEDFGRQAYFVNIPSKFISDDGLTMWICYSANYMFDEERNNPEFIMREKPAGSAYSLSLHEFKLKID